MRKRFVGEQNYSAYRPIERRSSDVDHKGLCSCGVETSRSVTVGPPGDPRNGWECSGCGEASLRAQFASSQVDSYLRKP